MLTNRDLHHRRERKEMFFFRFIFRIYSFDESHLHIHIYHKIFHNINAATVSTCRKGYWSGSLLSFRLKSKKFDCSTFRKKNNYSVNIRRTKGKLENSSLLRINVRNKQSFSRILSTSVLCPPVKFHTFYNIPYREGRNPPHPKRTVPLPSPSIHYPIRITIFLFENAFEPVLWCSVFYSPECVVRHRHLLRRPALAWTLPIDPQAARASFSSAIEHSIECIAKLYILNKR